MVNELKLERVQGVLIEEAQAKVYSKLHKGILYAVLPSKVEGYAIAFKKGSPLTKEVNAAIRKLKNSGSIRKLERTWFSNASSSVTYIG